MLEPAILELDELPPLLPNRVHNNAVHHKISSDWQALSMAGSKEYHTVYVGRNLCAIQVEIFDVPWIDLI